MLCFVIRLLDKLQFTSFLNRGVNKLIEAISADVISGNCARFPNYERPVIDDDGLLSDIIAAKFKRIKIEIAYF